MNSIYKYIRLGIGIILASIAYLFQSDPWSPIVSLLGLLLIGSFFYPKLTILNKKINNDKPIKNKIPKNEKFEKDKKIGIFGIIIFMIGLAGMKMLAYNFEYFIFSEWIDTFIIIIITLFGLYLSTGYWNTLFDPKKYL